MQLAGYEWARAAFEPREPLVDLLEERMQEAIDRHLGEAMGRDHVDGRNGSQGRYLLT